jgi:hypothetical protein
MFDVLQKVLGFRLWALGPAVRFHPQDENEQPAITHRRLLRILEKPKYISPIREAGIE